MMYFSDNISATLLMLGNEVTIIRPETGHLPLGEQRLRTVEETDSALRIFETGLVCLGVIPIPEAASLLLVRFYDA